eukprot:GHVO01017138.1.p1 GENE.GHVO01017138.1~~GHVO01017138.1.p1  ORF type:complete len:843 (+),score=171.13 GHVO01017138.1:161-2530(+)
MDAIKHELNTLIFDAYFDTVQTIENKLLSESSSSSSYLPLNSILAETRNVKDKFQIIISIFKRASEIDPKLTAVSLIDACCQTSSSGDDLAEGISKPLLRRLLSVFILQMRWWCVESRIVDPFEEFFISSDDCSPHPMSQNIYRGGYIRPKHVPLSIMSTDSAKNVSYVGNVHRIIKDTEDNTKKNVADLNSQFDAMEEELRGTREIIEMYSVIERRINAIRSHSGHRLYSYLYNGCNFTNIITIVHGVVLLSNGEFSADLLSVCEGMGDNPDERQIGKKLEAIVAERFSSKEIYMDAHFPIRHFNLADHFNESIHIKDPSQIHAIPFADKIEILGNSDDIILKTDSIMIKNPHKASATIRVCSPIVSYSGFTSTVSLENVQHFGISLDCFGADQTHDASLIVDINIDTGTALIWEIRKNEKKELSKINVPIPHQKEKLIIRTLHSSWKTSIYIASTDCPDAPCYKDITFPRVSHAPKSTVYIGVILFEDSTSNGCPSVVRNWTFRSIGQTSAGYQNPIVERLTWRVNIKNEIEYISPFFAVDVIDAFNDIHRFLLNLKLSLATVSKINTIRFCVKNPHPLYHILLFEIRACLNAIVDYIVNDIIRHHVSQFYEKWESEKDAERLIYIHERMAQTLTLECFLKNPRVREHIICLADLPGRILGGGENIEFLRSHFIDTMTRLHAEISAASLTSQHWKTVRLAERLNFNGYLTRSNDVDSDSRSPSSRHTYEEEEEEEDTPIPYATEKVRLTPVEGAALKGRLEAIASSATSTQTYVRLKRAQDPNADQR